MKQALLLLFALIPLSGVMAQKATVREEKIVMNTYPFFDPNPVVNPDRIYPYFRFDGYTNHGEEQEWKMVVLENDYVKVFVCPDVGGKIWGAIEKSTGKEFIYFNHSAKFRDVAMRGAWSSGGLEYNFGDIGHIPTCATPVDYVMNEYSDGSVACVVGAIDLPSGTKWNVEIKLQKDKAYFETIASWHNTSALPVTYYHWMNAAAKADGDLEFIYPGNKRIGHGGEIGEWPHDNGREIAMYENNNFGIYKSYHVINAYANFFGGYWHADDFGFGHYSSYDDKPGKKIWIWGLSDQGMIWEDLLTDSDGQYIEYQAGKLFNQAAHSSTYTPFKHREFMPFDSDIMHELWFPLKNTGGMVAASEYGVLNVEHEPGKIELKLSPLQTLQSKIIVKAQGKEVFSDQLSLSPLQLYTKEIALNAEGSLTVEIGDKQLYYTSDQESDMVNRPLQQTVDFNWESAHGHYITALELEKQRRYPEALEAYQKSYQQEATFLPVLGRLAMAYYRKMDYQSSLEYGLKGLSIDTYDPLSNYVYGLVNSALNNRSEAKSGFSMAAQSVTYRSAAYAKLAELYLQEKDLAQAVIYAQKALRFNTTNVSVLEILAVCYRQLAEHDKALQVLDHLYTLDACNVFVSFEKETYTVDGNGKWFKDISNELPHETYLDLAIRYCQLGCNDEALEVLKASPVNPIVLIWQAHLDGEHSVKPLSKALDLSASMVFPHRNATLEVLKRLMTTNEHWKLKYYAGIINWQLNNIDQAQVLFNQCGTNPDFVAFYLSKIMLFKGDDLIEAAALKTAAEIDAADWRLNQALIDLHMKKGEYKKAADLAKKYHHRYPEKSLFGMKYAEVLLKQEKYQKCLSFLEGFNVLPYEGATEGRHIYHETCLRSAFSELCKGNYEKAVWYAQKAKLWPSNLGVGKHYDVDERLDNFVIALAYEKLNNKQEADLYYYKVMNHNTPSYLNESSKFYLQALTLEKFNQIERANEMMHNALESEPENIYLQWVKSEFVDHSSSEIESKIHNTKVEVQVYDTKFVDGEFQLVTDFVKLLHHLP